MNGSLALREWFLENIPTFSKGIEEARTLDTGRFDRLADLFLSWAEGFLGPHYLDKVCRSYAGFTTSVNFHQARYELSGHYEATSKDSFHEGLYQREERMDDYLWGVYLTTFLWPHHLVLAKFYEQNFLPHVAPGSTIVELASGHGAWGLWALSQTENTTLQGIDIAASSIRIAGGLAKSAGLPERADYRQGDALAPAESPEFDAAICGFVVEHLEQPIKLFESLSSRLHPGGILFLTGALTAAQEDHVFEFVRESELLLMAEKAGFRVRDMSSQGPLRTLRDAKYLPRSMAMVLEKRRSEFY